MKSRKLRPSSCTLGLCGEDAICATSDYPSQAPFTFATNVILSLSDIYWAARLILRSRFAKPPAKCRLLAKISSPQSLKFVFVWFGYATKSRRATAQSHAATSSRDKVTRKKSPRQNRRCDAGLNTHCYCCCCCCSSYTTQYSWRDDASVGLCLVGPWWAYRRGVVSDVSKIILARPRPPTLSLVSSKLTQRSDPITGHYHNARHLTSRLTWQRKFNSKNSNIVTLLGSYMNTVLSRLAMEWWTSTDSAVTKTVSARPRPRAPRSVLKAPEVNNSGSRRRRFHGNNRWIAPAGDDSCRWTKVGCRCSGVWRRGSELPRWAADVERKYHPVPRRSVTEAYLGNCCQGE